MMQIPIWAFIVLCIMCLPTMLLGLALILYGIDGLKDLKRDD